MQWIGLLLMCCGIAAEKTRTMRTEAPDKHADPFPIMSLGHPHQKARIGPASVESRFTCEALDIADAKESTAVDGGKDYTPEDLKTRQHCSDECWRSTSCPGFTFQVADSNVAAHIVEATATGICRIDDLGRRISRASVGNTLVCMSRKCKRNEIATNTCLCEYHDGVNECIVGTKCMDNGACEHRLACKKQECMLASYTNELPSCTAKCGASELWRGESGEFKLSSTRVCAYDTMVDQECFCQPDTASHGKQITLQNLCTPNTKCVRSGFCVCDRDERKVYDVKQEQLYCRPKAQRALVACCDDANKVYFSGAEDQGECLEPANLYDASRTCAHNGGKTLCSLAALIGVRAESCISSFARTWIIPNQKCQPNELTHGECYCEHARDICGYGQLCRAGGCVRVCPAKDAPVVERDFEYCACGAGQENASMTICAMGQTCHPNIGWCEGDGFHTLSHGTCFVPPELSENANERKCFREVSGVTRNKCASACTASKECVCHGFTSTEDEGEMPVHCKLLYSPIDLSLLRQGDECSDDRSLLHPLRGERQCGAEENLYSRCVCGITHCQYGMRCNVERGVCENKCVCDGEPWWGSECPTHNSVQCQACAQQFLEDGQCKVGPNQPCYSPPTEDATGQTNPGVPKRLCALKKRCLVRTHVGLGQECDYGKVRCICEPLIILPSNDPIVDIGEDCGGNPNLRCKQGSCTAKEGGSDCTTRMALSKCQCAASFAWLYIVLAVAGVLVIGILFFCWCRRRNNSVLHAPNASSPRASSHGSESGYSATEI